MTASTLVIQRDHTLLVTPGDGRDEIAAVARWVGQLKAIIAGSYLYEPTPIALWGAASRGITADRLLNALQLHSRDAVPSSFAAWLAEFIGRYGRLRIEDREGASYLVADDPTVFDRLSLHLPGEGGSRYLEPGHEGRVKVEAARQGWPVVDRRPAAKGRKLAASLRNAVELRPYQRVAVDSFRQGGSGLILLPCGAGKTVVGVAALVATGRSTLILVPSRAIATQWVQTLLAMTDIHRDEVSILERGARPTAVTIVTYHSATRATLAGEIVDYPWGLIIYDEVQSLPADVFRLAASFQSVRRLGLTATLVREDGREREIFALVGPPLYDVSWVELEYQGWIAPARCVEVRIPPAEDRRAALKYRLAVLQRLLHRHQGEPTLVVGARLDSLRAAAERFGLPLVTGKVSHEEREALYGAFREGRLDALALSKVGSVGVDLPAASVMIQISGTFGSRQEEAQRLGRLLRPRSGKNAHFYALVETGTREEEYARRRQRFLVDQGYQYEILQAADLPRPD